MTGRLLIGLIRIYQIALSPLTGNCCRFYPCCSAYSAEAIRRHGAARGVMLGLRRILKCHPFHPGGVDLVPETEDGTDAVGKETTGMSIKHGQGVNGGRGRGTGL